MYGVSPVSHIAGILEAYNKILDDMVWATAVPEKLLHGQPKTASEVKMHINPLTGRWEDELVRETYHSSSHFTTTNFSGMTMGIDPASPGAHFGSVRRMRIAFKSFSKEEFREISNQPVVKNIMSGMTKLNEEEIKERIKAHLSNME